jgi:molybdenum cofactor guanylyltransferase
MPETTSIGAFVLAGGLSRRMGRNKALLQWHGRSLVDHMLSLLSSAFAPVQVIGDTLTPDRVQGAGPLGGIATALEITQTNKCLIVAVDLPLLTPEFLKMFKTRIETSSRHLVACKIESAYPLCLGVDQTLLGMANQRIEAGQLSVQCFIENSDAEILTDVDPSMFFNVNTPEDWNRLLDFH